MAEAIETAALQDTVSALAAMREAGHNPEVPILAALLRRACSSLERACADAQDGPATGLDALAGGARPPARSPALLPGRYADRFEGAQRRARAWRTALRRRR
jgi:hypothetical protein